jgi:hypothetical protein
VVVEDHVGRDPAHELSDEGLAERDAVTLQELVEVIVRIDALKSSA